MPRDEKPKKKGNKQGKQNDGPTDALDRILDRRNAATKAAPAKNTAPAKGSGPAAKKPGAQPAAKPQAKPVKKDKSYTAALEGVDEVDQDETESRLAQARALRNEDYGEEALADRKDKSKAEKRREDKIQRQLNEKFEDSLNEEAVIISESGVEIVAPDDDGEVRAEQDCLRVEPFSLQFKGTTLFHETSLVLAAGNRYGLVGPNGSGKSTFLRAVSGRKLPGMDPNMDLLHVEQEVDGTDQIALESVLAADTKRAALLEQKKQLEELDISTLSEDQVQEHNQTLERVYSDLRAIGADSAPARAAKILAGLQFTPEMQRQATKEFSGGWRMRIALARALFRQPSLLLLDEPTNHLDLHAVIWLEEYLRRWKKTLVIVSHDRDFLNSVVTGIVHIYDKKLHLYRGNFDSFTKTFETKKRAQDKLAKKQEKQLKDYNKMLHGDASAGGKAKKGASKQMTAAQRKAKEREMEKVQQEKVSVSKEYRVSFAFPDPSHELEHPVIQVNDVSFSYPPAEGEERGKLIFRDLNFAVDMDSRISLVGPNGSGKSTLLGLLFGKLSPSEGSVSIKKGLRIGYFTQHFVDQLDMSISPVQHLAKRYPELADDYQTLRKALGSFGLEGKLHLKPIQKLSGGQKNRVVFATIALGNPDILYLDEPTNHLDMESIEALASALEDFSGGVVVVSHDARLINAICNDIWVIGNQTVKTNFEGTIFDYRQSLIDALTEDDFE